MIRDLFSTLWFYLLLVLLSSIHGWLTASKTIVSGVIAYLFLFGFKHFRPLAIPMFGGIDSPSITVTMTAAMLPWTFLECKYDKIKKLVVIVFILLIVSGHRLVTGSHNFGEILSGLLLGFIVVFTIHSIWPEKVSAYSFIDKVSVWPNSVYIPQGLQTKWGRAEVAERYPDVASPLFSDLFLTSLGRSVQRMGRSLEIKKTSSIIGYSIDKGLIFSNMRPSNLRLVKVILLLVQMRKRYNHYYRVDYKKAKRDFGSWKNDIESSLTNASTLSDLYGVLLRSLSLFETWMFHQSVSLFYHTLASIYLKIWFKLHFPKKTNQILPQLTRGLKTPTFNEYQILFNLGEELEKSASRTEPHAESVHALLDAYMQLVGDKFPTYDFAETPWREMPEKILHLALNVFSEGESPKAQLERQKSERLAAEEVLRKRIKCFHPFRSRLLYRDILRITRTINTFKEERQIQMSAAWGLVRRTLTEIGNKLSEQGLLCDFPEIFYLTASELSWILRKGNGKSPNPDVTKLHELTHVAKLRMNRFVSLKATSEVEVTGRESILDFRLRNLLGLWGKSRYEDPNVLRGSYSLGGTIEGIAAVISGPSEFDKMKKGMILVAPATNPHWDVLISLASGLITETGSPLSHPFIKANEYGLPAVLGVKRACKRIRNGDRITIDGKTKSVTIVERK